MVVGVYRVWPPEDAVELVRLWYEQCCQEIEVSRGVVVRDLGLWFSPTMVPVGCRDQQLEQVRFALGVVENDF